MHLSLQLHYFRSSALSSKILRHYLALHIWHARVRLFEIYIYIHLIKIHKIIFFLEQLFQRQAPLRPSVLINKKQTQSSVQNYIMLNIT